MTVCNFIKCSIKDCIKKFEYKQCEVYRQTTEYHCRNCNNTFRDNLPLKCPYCGSYAIVTKPPKGGDELPPPYNNLGQVGKLSGRKNENKRGLAEK